MQTTIEQLLDTQLQAHLASRKISSRKIRVSKNVRGKSELGKAQEDIRRAVNGSKYERRFQGAVKTTQENAQ